MIAALKGRDVAHLMRKVKDYKKGYWKFDAYVSRCGLVVVPTDYLKEHPDDLQELKDVTCRLCNRLRMPRATD